MRSLPTNARPRTGKHCKWACLITVAFGLGLDAWCVTAPVAQAQSADIEATIQQYLDKYPEAAKRFVKDYLAKHPEVMQEALTDLVRRHIPAPSDKSEIVRKNAVALFDSAKRVPFGNPNGGITLVEFVDYNCAYCRRALNDMLDLLSADAKLKIVLIEHPVLGAGSVEAARVAIALQMQDGRAASYLDLHRKLLASPGPVGKARALAIAAELGADVTRLEAGMAAPEVDVRLEENRKLARELGVRGTPSYVVGDRVIFGAVGVTTLRDAIAAARQK